MSYNSGFVPQNYLRTVAPGTQLLNPVANAYQHMKMIAFMLDGVEVRPAGTYGAGYRDFATAMVFYLAGRGDAASRRRIGIDPNLKVTIAFPPGSHGRADRCDILWNGHSPSDADLRFARMYGWVQEFGGADRNHLKHDGRTAISGVRAVHKFALLGRFYNNRHLGKQTDTERTGRPDEEFIWLAQHYGHMECTYPHHCKEDGRWGPFTEKAIDHEWGLLKAAYHREHGA